ncbi:translation elongation factor EF-1, subunit alpha [Reticulomyxa filosa]|uniref:Translation elongation factor EF-1, subunit alpha n=1 Tax=Reticulomyxa filosa TaxID=46433 RepID=X6MP67_RETFI|nr:translation elongation factor EF-1, subunit alpha [Reticulomyxa filosa]|eukprot:ETO15659.1 translation elongation factor EF-1, subunit alpha [Reticulomyxa filosa]
MDALEKIFSQPKRSIKKSFRMPISDVYDIKGMDYMITRHIGQGTITPCVHVKKENMPQTGDVICVYGPAHQNEQPNLPLWYFFKIISGQLKASTNDGKGNYKGKLHCQMLEIKWKMRKAINNATVNRATFIEAGDQTAKNAIRKMAAMSKLVDCAGKSCVNKIQMIEQNN